LIGVLIACLAAHGVRTRLIGTGQIEIAGGLVAVSGRLLTRETPYVGR
jgi:hypothetical protein